MANTIMYMETVPFTAASEVLKIVWNSLSEGK